MSDKSSAQPDNLQPGDPQFLVIILEWDRCCIFAVRKDGQGIKIRTIARESYIQNNEFVRLYLAAVFRADRDFRKIAQNIRSRYFGGQIEIFDYDEVILAGEASIDLDLFWCVCRLLGRIPLRIRKAGADSAGGGSTGSSDTGSSNTGSRKGAAPGMCDKALLLWASLLYRKLDPEQKAELKRVTIKYLHTLFDRKLPAVRAARKEYEEMLDWLEADLWMR